MGVSSTANRVLLAGNGSSVTFAFPYYFFNQTDLQVWVYDTILGGTVQKVLNTDYTISGTPNLQGLYQNGANIVFGTAPLATSIVVIFRNPPEVNNYALIQNQNISSAAIVQQFDYLTLLIQRLEDQIANAIQMPDGLGEMFSNILPSTGALSPGLIPMINAAANGWIFANASGWQTMTIPYTSFQTGSMIDIVNLFTLPAGCILAGLTIKHSASFTGSGITDVQADIGISGAASKFLAAFDVLQAPGDQVFDYVIPNYIGSWANPTAIQMRMVSTGANLANLTTGSVTVTYSMINAT